ncbi:hypothetical protein FNV43_RR25554 [Rhamnella rubrinervis]|uniref:LRAT domain-containing protein n=1 Tax=Rhamnella rubrinervis TaxID=2594499 RepID=A0A8K0DPV5_9ROSA|nr:hypothetical protein FNV43_RR25554 [Rhamnella rubrinervis]
MAKRSNKIGMEELSPGDHIYTWSSYTYSRHDLLYDGHLYRFEYGVSRFVFLMNRPGTCTLAYGNPPEQVLHRASYFLQHGFGNYDLVDCEDFALYCKTGFVKRNKTGDIISGAIILFFAAFVAVTVIPYRFLPAGLIGILLVVCGLYCWLRLRADVRYRSDCAVVAVEKLQDDLSDAHNERENMSTIEKKSTRWFLRRMDYIRYTLLAIGLSYSTPESKILVRLKSFFVYIYFSGFVSEHLSLLGFQLGEYSAYTIWLLGYFYWRWTSVDAILL